MRDQFNEAKIKLADGRVAFDCVKLAQIETEGISLVKGRNIPQDCNIVVRTVNTDYTLTVRGDNIMVRDERRDGRPNRFPEFVSCNIHGSTWGGSMLKMNYIGVGMYLEFHTTDHDTLTTSEIQSLTVKAL